MFGHGGTKFVIGRHTEKSSGRVQIFGSTLLRRGDGSTKSDLAASFFVKNAVPTHVLSEGCRLRGSGGVCDGYFTAVGVRTKNHGSGPFWCTESGRLGVTGLETDPKQGLLF